MIINQQNKTISISEKMSDTNFAKAINQFWMKTSDYWSLGYPIRREGDSFVFTYNWRFADIESYKNVNPIIKMKKPISPLVPSQTKKYERIYVIDDDAVTVEKLLAKCPKEINYRNIHIKSKDGKIYLEIAGQWPNPDYETEKKKFQKQYKMWEKEYLFYESINKNT